MDRRWCQKRAVCGCGRGHFCAAAVFFRLLCLLHLHTRQQQNGGFLSPFSIFHFSKPAAVWPRRRFFCTAVSLLCISLLFLCCSAAAVSALLLCDELMSSTAGAASRSCGKKQVLCVRRTGTVRRAVNTVRRIMHLRRIPWDLSSVKRSNGVVRDVSFNHQSSSQSRSRSEGKDKSICTLHRIIFVPSILIRFGLLEI